MVIRNKNKRKATINLDLLINLNKEEIFDESASPNNSNEEKALNSDLEN